jgi:hypothetical protein
MYSTFNIIAASFSLAIIKDRDTFFSYPAKIETLSIIFSISRLISAKTVDRFLTVLSASARSLT